jgi:predicted metalloprotease with PDZ domain
VSTYNFLLYHFAASQPRPTFGEGLEHSASTVILLHMMMNEEEISRSVYGIASHEFLHTILPLALHSEEIENYDFSGPTMSKHLWLYEGMTEYFTMHIPVKGGAISHEDFFRTVEGKIAGMREFDSTLSLTSLSKQAVQRQDQYMNVYLRGALVSLCLDIRLRELSGGKLGVQELVALLLKEYGPDKPFKDDELFDKIVAVSGHPEIREFIMKYIEGGYQPPLYENLIKTGLKLGPDGKINSDPNASASQLLLRKQWLGGN